MPVLAFAKLTSMYVLTVDTSTSYVVAGIVEVSAHSEKIETVAERIVDNPRGHMELLTPHIVECLAEAQLQPDQLDAVVVGVGPGPFTGLRVGMATAQAFADALSIPLHGVESTAALAARAFAQVGDENQQVSDLLVCTDARRREWYWGHYHLNGDGVLETVAGPGVAKPEDVLNSPEAQHPLVMSKAIAGDVDAEYSVLDSDACPTPESLLKEAMMRVGGSFTERMKSIRVPGEPLRALYLRRPDAVEPKRKAPSEAVDFAAAEGHAGTGETPEASVPAGDDVRLVRLDISAAPAMAHLEQVLFQGDSPWPIEAIEYELSRDNTHYLGLERETARGLELVGYLGLAQNGSSTDPEWEIHTVGLAPGEQGKGLSNRLLQAGLEIVDALGGDTFLEVRTDNYPAIGLYERYGFLTTRIRKNYYQPSGADAYSMMRPALNSSVNREELRLKKAAQGEVKKNDSLVILGVETSCDETGVGIVELDNSGPSPHVRMISNRVASSMEQHARFGGVVPEIASRAHLEAMGPTMREALRDLRRDRQVQGLPTRYMEKPDAVAATIGPGLAGALLVGAAAAKAYAAAWQVPFYAVNHLGGHVAVDLLDTAGEGRAASTMNNAIALLASGGHTQILHVQGVGKPMEEMGGTLDDAAGEAYDKVARLLGLGYPGGPVIDALAARGNPQAIAFPRAMMRQQDARYDFSFSGLKTAVARHVEKAEREGETLLVEDVCASFQEAVCDVLTRKAVRAAQDKGATTMLLGGGVSANSRLRELLAQRCAEAGIELHVPPFALCTDNGVMIAALAAQLIAEGAQPSGLTVGTDPGLDVEVPLV